MTGEPPSAQNTGLEGGPRGQAAKQSVGSVRGSAGPAGDL